MTEFENEIKGLLFDAGDKYNLNTDLDTAVIDLAPHFLEAARKQLINEIDVDAMANDYFLDYIENDVCVEVSKEHKDSFIMGAEAVLKAIREKIAEKGCKDCWHNYHCPIPQEGYNYNPDTCPYNPDNKK